MEKISKYGFSPQRGQWAIVAEDFLSSFKYGNAYSEGSNENSIVKLRSNNGASSTTTTDVKLYGVDWIEFGVSNSGCGRHWMEEQLIGIKIEPSSGFLGFKLVPVYRYTEQSEHDFYTKLI